MAQERFRASASGVRIADSFRDNLIIDRYDPVFSGMRASKMKHLRSENSEDALTWNAFRSLRQIEPSIWMPHLCEAGLPGHLLPTPASVTVELWRTVKPPPSLLEIGDEGSSEIDVVLEHPEWIWFIEAKYHSDISAGTTTRPLRNQVLRNLDVGSYYAGVRPFYFSLLVQSEEQSPDGCKAVREYATLSRPRSELAGHRPDGLANIKAVTLLRWSDLCRVLARASAQATRSDEKGYADRAIEWFTKKGLQA